MRLFDVSWTPALERELAEIFCELRYHTPAAGDCSTPELFAGQAGREWEVKRDFLGRVRAALERSGPRVLDCEVIEATEKLRHFLTPVPAAIARGALLAG